MKSAFALAAVLAAGGAPALAADVPGDTGTTATLPARTYVNGSFDFEGDADWFRVQLQAGVRYAIGSTEPANTLMALQLRDAAGAVVGSYGGYDTSSTATSRGFEFAVPADGTYYVEVVAASAPVYPTAYALLLDDADCVDSLRGDCAIRPGQTLRAVMAWWEDGDYVWLRATAGALYTVRVDACEAIGLRVYGREGAVKAVGTSDASGASLKWRAPQSKWYAIRVLGTDGGEQGTPYDLGVSQGARVAPRPPVSGCQVAVTKALR